MRRVILLIVSVALILGTLVSCAENDTSSVIESSTASESVEIPDAKAILEGIDLNDVSLIYATSQRRSPIQRVTVDPDLWQELIDKLISLEPHNGEEDKKKGWSHYFRIELKSGEAIPITFVDGKMRINGFAYEINEYSYDELEYFCNGT